MKLRSQAHEYEGRYVDQTTWFLGISFLSCEGTSVATRACADCNPGQFLIGSTTHCRFTQRLKQLQQLVIVHRLYEVAIEPCFF